MFIKKSTIEKVEDVADIVEVIGEFVQLSKKGANWFGLSPFVDEKSPSFSVSITKNLWKCFASGTSGVGALSFLMAKNFSYPDAIKHLAQKYSIEVEYEDKEAAKKYMQKEERKNELLPLMESVTKKFEESFWALPEDHPAKVEVFQNRKYTKDLAKEYRIGYAPGRKFIYDLCVKHGKKADAQDIGLISEKGDKWVDRVIYPLTQMHHGKSIPIGVSGRRLSEEKKYAKWMNPINSKIYQKERFWYGLDKAQASIVKSKQAWIVEGYNDVIAWQRFGITNTVASCGTSINTNQIKVLKKYCSHVIFCMDPDEAGKRSILKYVQDFLKAGFRTHVVILKDGLDPDDYVRAIEAEDEAALDHLKETKTWTDGFKFLIDENKTDDEIENAQLAKDFVKLIHQIDDEVMQDIYLQWLAKETGQKIATINKYMKAQDIEELLPDRNTSREFDLYELPDEVKEPLEKLLPTIQRYRLFQANSMIYVQFGDEAPYRFRSVSNFSIEIIQHMNDEKFPKKLVRVRNIHKHESVFDMASEAINTPNSFENAITNYGNYQWRGKREDHQLLKSYLFDGMGTGRQVEVLGWQPEGFWVWNNLVITEEGEKLDIDKNGCFDYKGVAYYTPSANSIFSSNHYKYDAQKRFISINTKTTFFDIAKRTFDVHGNHGLMGILFGISSIFQDIVVKELSSFPILFLYGPPSSGKDQLAEVVQGFMGMPQTAINLEGSASTTKAQIREFAQFGNGISQLSEYKPGDPGIDGILKGLWDRRGYKRGNIESHVGTDSIPILSSAIITSNFYPDQEALITRLVSNLMDRTTFSEQEDKHYAELSDLIKKGFSGLTNEFMKYRKDVEDQFKAQFRAFKSFLKEQNPNVNSRMIQNLSVFGAIYKITSNYIEFPYNMSDIMKVFGKVLQMQMNKLDSASIINRFWDCFLASLRGNHTDILIAGRDFRLDGQKLYYSWTNVYNKVSRQWYMQYKEGMPSKTVMSDALKKEPSWVDYLNSFRYSPGVSSSAYCTDLADLNIREEIAMAIQFQEDKVNPQTSAFPPDGDDSPVTPDDENNKGKKSELPF